MSKLKVIKAVVFILTFVIVFALVVLINKLAGIEGKPQMALEDNIVLSQPLGSTIKDILTKDNYLYITVSGGNLADRIVIVDMNDGRVVSNIGLN